MERRAMWLGIAVVIWLILVFVVLVVWSRHWRHVRWQEGIDEEAHAEGREDDPREGQRADPLIVLRVEPASTRAGG